MSYWLYCTACEQWSKSATPLSDDKTCSFCHKKYTKLNRTSDKEVSPDVEEVQAEIPENQITGNPSEAETSMTEPTQSSPPVAAAEEIEPVPALADEEEISSVDDEKDDSTARDEAEPWSETDALEGEAFREEDEAIDTSESATSADTMIKKAPIERKGRMSKKR